jgi:hypothetical protein
MQKARRIFDGSRLQGESLPLPMVLGVALVLAFTWAPVGICQSGPGSSGVQGPTARGSFPVRTDTDPMMGGDYDPMMMERRLRALNMERQKEMVSDTNKLLKLARELNQEVASQKSDALTPDQLHKIAEIEKLARNVKERMSTGVGESQSVIPPAALVYPLH